MPGPCPGRYLSQLHAEAHRGELWHRRFQTASLAAAAAADPGAFADFADASKAGDLDWAWLDRVAAERPPSELEPLLVARLRTDPATWAERTAYHRMLARVAPKPSPTLIAAALFALERLALPSQGLALIALLPLFRTLPSEQLRPVVAQLWPSLDKIEDPEQRDAISDFLVDHATVPPVETTGSAAVPDHAWPRWLLEAPWLERLLRAPHLVAQLDPVALTTAAGRTDDQGLLLEVVYPALDRWMRRDRGRTQAALVAHGAWRPWLARARLKPQGRRELSLAWMASLRGTLGVAGGDDPGPLAWYPEHWRCVGPSGCRIAKEDWDCAIEALGTSVDEVALDRIVDISGQWPAIYPFEPQQILQLARCCASLGTLAELADRLADAAGHLLGLDLGDLVAATPLAEGVDGQTLAWLCRAPALSAQRGRSPSLSASARLMAVAGARMAKAVEARVTAVLDRLRRDPAQALDAAERPSLWADPGFRAGLRKRLHQARGAERQVLCTQLERCLESLHSRAGEDPPAAAPSLPSELARALRTEGFERVAAFVDIDGDLSS